MTFSETGGLVSVPAGSGYLGVQPVVLVSRESPNGVQVLMHSLLCRALDIDVSQITFSFRRNGTSLVSGLTSIPATMFDSGGSLPIDEVLPTGMFDIVAYNLSGTGLPNAIVAVSSLCQASWTGSLRVIESSLKFKNSLFPSAPSFRRGFLT